VPGTESPWRWLPKGNAEDVRDVTNSIPRRPLPDPEGAAVDQAAHEHLKNDGFEGGYHE